MKKKVYSLFLSVVCILGAACISFKIKPLFPPDNRVENFCLCAEIDDSGELLIPLDVKLEFSAENEDIICFIELKDIEKKIKLKWNWYSPDKKLYKETEEITVNEQEKYLEAVTAYDKIRPEHSEISNGRWAVVVFLDDVLAGRKIFQVKKPGGKL